MSLIVVAGIVGVVLVRSDNGAGGTPPQPGDPATGAEGDHWHAAFAVNVCGEWLTSPETFETAAGNPNVRVGIHTHGDGFIHIHPFTRSEGGDNATLGRFLSYGGWSASDGSLTTWIGPTADPAKTTWSDGEKCPPGTPMEGRAGVVSWSIDCEAATGEPADHKLRDQEVLALGFLPKGEAIGVPPNAQEAPSNDGTDSGPLDSRGCRAAAPDSASTTTAPTVAPGTESTTLPTTAPTAAP
jgi:hypothetical protein